jgi:tetratricopeptide (TPR) repeat protein
LFDAPVGIKFALAEHVDSKTPSLELLPLDAPAADPLGGEHEPWVEAKKAVEAEAAPVDPYFAAATAEFEGGDVDKELWDRALAQAKGGDRETAISGYLRARATVLKVTKREPRTINYPPVRVEPAAARVLASPKPSRLESSEPEEVGVEVEPPRAKYNPRAVTIAATGAGVLVCASLLYVLLGSVLSPKPDVATAATPVSRAARPPPVPPAQPAPKTEHDGVSASQELLAKIEELRLAGNWHVLVLYAGEWTRRDPRNAAAWNELSLGYERLRQFDDAYNAATKAVALAPEIALYWRNLGQLDVELNLPEEALRAFEGATALDDRDLHSLVQAGLLYWRLARAPEAKVALDKALALSTDDPDALCLKALIANRPAAPKALNAGAKQSGPREMTCRDFTDVKDAPVVAKSLPPPATVLVPRKR